MGPRTGAGRELTARGHGDAVPRRDQIGRDQTGRERAQFASARSHRPAGVAGGGMCERAVGRGWVSLCCDRGSWRCVRVCVCVYVCVCVCARVPLFGAGMEFAD